MGLRLFSLLVASSLLLGCGQRNAYRLASDFRRPDNPHFDLSLKQSPDHADTVVVTLINRGNTATAFLPHAFVTLHLVGPSDHPFSELDSQLNYAWSDTELETIAPGGTLEGSIRPSDRMDLGKTEAGKYECVIEYSDSGVNHILSRGSLKSKKEKSEVGTVYSKPFFVVIQAGRLSFEGI